MDKKQKFQEDVENLTDALMEDSKGKVSREDARKSAEWLLMNLYRRFDKEKEQNP